MNDKFYESLFFASYSFISSVYDISYTVTLRVSSKFQLVEVDGIHVWKVI